jgi:hypothetical protein
MPSPTPTFTAPLLVRFTPEDREILEALAERAGVPQAVWIRNEVRARAETLAA